MTIPQFTLRPLSSVAGAEVSGLDLRDDISDEAQHALEEAWLRYGLLLFRGQDLTEDQQRKAASIFGRLETRGMQGETGTSYVSNVVERALNPRGALGFHQDQSFLDEPLRGIMLYALETPPPGAGGDTLFSNAHLAHAGLPEALRRRIAGLRIRHQARQHPQHPWADHPLAFAHPLSGETVLFFSGRHFDRILDVSDAENEMLAATLAAAIDRDEIVYRHTWQPGDLVLWDNLTLYHARTDFDPRYRRHMRRMQVSFRSGS